MEFTYKAYKSLIKKILGAGYRIIDYYSARNIEDKICILRHDIDYDIDKALKLCSLEHELDQIYSGVHATYFVLLTSDFYNVFSKKSVTKLKQILKLKGDIGLHFDEKRYLDNDDKFDRDLIIEKVEKEAQILRDLLETDITTVSFHRPSKAFLDADIEFPSLINSYSKYFFSEFKYISDSRRRWRGDVDQIISEGKYPRLHILTHAFWYNETELDLRSSLYEYMDMAPKRCWDSFNDNFTDLEQVIKRDEI